MTSQLVGSDFTDGALLPNYVNGRLLVAEDLATGQASLRTRDTRAGEAAGAGIVRGLCVTASGSTLTVADGLGMSRAGEPVVVPQPTALQLSFTTIGTTSDRSSFSCCVADTPEGTGSTLGQGMLLLTARAACKLDGASPMAPSPSSEISPCCAAQWLVSGVEFRAITLPVGTSVDDIPLTVGNRRNLVAHWLYGTERLVHLGEDPFSFAPAYTGLDLLDPADLTAYDVPLAVFRWDGTTIADLDNWSARRRVTEPDPVTASWSMTTADHRASDGEARFLQFQDQAEELVSRGVALSTHAGDVFGLLPPVGFLPVDNAHLVTVAESSVKRLRLLAAREAVPVTKEAATQQAAAQWAARLPAEAEAEHLTETASLTPADRVLQAHTATDTLKERAFTTSAASLEAGIAYYQGLYQVGTASVGYGFDPRTFFGGLARFGGVLDWQLAEWALHQSWRAFPVPVLASPLAQQQPVDQAAALAGAGNRASQQPQVPPITYYYVVENIEAAGTAVSIGRQDLRSYVKRRSHSFVRSNLYVVFIANRRWVEDTLPPFMAVPFAEMKGFSASGSVTGLLDET